jgi:hypothetical protein
VAASHTGHYRRPMLKKKPVKRRKAG